MKEKKKKKKKNDRKKNNIKIYFYIIIYNTFKLIFLIYLLFFHIIFIIDYLWYIYVIINNLFLCIFPIFYLFYLLLHHDKFLTNFNLQNLKEFLRVLDLYGDFIYKRIAHYYLVIYYIFKRKNWVFHQVYVKKLFN